MSIVSLVHRFSPINIDLQPMQTSVLSSGGASVVSWLLLESLATAISAPVKPLQSVPFLFVAS